MSWKAEKYIVKGTYGYGRYVRLKSQTGDVFNAKVAEVTPLQMKSGIYIKSNDLMGSLIEGCRVAREYYIDLLFFNRRIKSLVAIDLKTGEFQPEYAGKMQFYLSLLDDHERMEGENPSVGIIICGKKNRQKVEYTLRYVVKPIGVATYNQYSKLEDLPKQIAEFLPSEHEITRRLGRSIV